LAVVADAVKPGALVRLPVEEAAAAVPQEPFEIPPVLHAGQRQVAKSRLFLAVVGRGVARLPPVEAHVISGGGAALRAERVIGFALDFALGFAVCAEDHEKRIFDRRRSSRVVKINGHGNARET